MSRYKIKRKAKNCSRMRRRRDSSLSSLRRNRITCLLLMRSMRCLSWRGLSRRSKNAMTQQKSQIEQSFALAKARLWSWRISASSCSSQIQVVVRGSANVGTQVNWLTSYMSSLTAVPTICLPTLTIRNCWSKSTEARVSHLSASYQSKMRSLRQNLPRVLQVALIVSLKTHQRVWTISSKPRQLSMPSFLSSLATQNSIRSSTAPLRNKYKKPSISWTKIPSMLTFRYSQQEAYA